MSNLPVNTTFPPQVYVLDIPTAVVWSLIGAAIIINNLTVMVIIISKKKLYTPTNIIMCSMFFDNILFACVYIYPRFTNPRFIQSWLYCSLTTVVGPMSLAIINLHLMSASLDKLIAMEYPVMYRNYSSVKVSITITIIIWIVALFTSFLPIFTYRQLRAGVCIQWLSGNQQYKEQIYNYVIICAFFIIPNIVMVYSYVRVYMIAKSHSIGDDKIKATYKRDSRHHYKTAYVLMTLAIVYFVTWTPFVVCYIFSLAITPDDLIHGRYPFYPTAVRVSQYLAFSYPAINPILYGYFIPTIRRVFMKVYQSTCHPNRVHVQSVDGFGMRST
ncbi:Trace amine-associated receptor 1 [Trichoplax sp. H2]|uniref:G-protein coupled receptors family 1 profile domain-containing protein n=1 Tax=Trichoplax adhaerens TaxID=10228 RepID=B3RL51_TRIAD|nr:hypothetical protein TRIADDRAFT_51879 [Trichoplax adhaerens]EDV28702.1 hypothetical protein TRIADDRAFT_51879 [Trichoplax adhaerens]RDD44998.1 Trace amine-associated receptor 1 [Trichoplax sp. H2]|eukprot:XP_002107904.1 hypothetical protein TRIADDRAFT_51879 [Trichoplax adhaerens]